MERTRKEEVELKFITRLCNITFIEYLSHMNSNWKSCMPSCACPTPEHTLNFLSRICKALQNCLLFEKKSKDSGPKGEAPTIHHHSFPINISLEEKTLNFICLEPGCFDPNKTIWEISPFFSCNHFLQFPKEIVLL